jgi:glutathione S-transferase
MTQLKLTYFDFHGGRGEAIRLALHIGGIAFEDFRFAYAEFGEVRKTTPLGQVPTLMLDGNQITQNNAIARYVAKQAALYPKDDFQALLCDEIMEAIEEIIHKTVATFPLRGAQQKLAREALTKGPLTQYLRWAEQQLVTQGGNYFVQDRLSIADLKVFVWLNSLNSGNLEHIDKDLVLKVAPKLNAFCQRIAQTPAIAGYYAK